MGAPQQANPQPTTGSIRLAGEYKLLPLANKAGRSGCPTPVPDDGFALAGDRKNGKGRAAVCSGKRGSPGQAAGILRAEPQEFILHASETPSRLVLVGCRAWFPAHQIAARAERFPVVVAEVVVARSSGDD